MPSPDEPPDPSTHLDDYLPHYDVTEVRHVVVDADPQTTYEAMLAVDLRELGPVVSALGRLRELPRALADRLRRTDREREPERMRIADVAETAEWTELADVPGEAFVFGAVGRFWKPAIEWRRVTAAEFAAFDDPGYAKLAICLSVQSVGEGRTLLTYEARTATTDERARRRFRWYWRVVGPFAGYVMAQALEAMAAEAKARAGKKSAEPDAVADVVLGGDSSDVSPAGQTLARRGLGVLGIAGVALLLGRLRRRVRARAVTDLRASATTDRGRVVDEDDLTDLPPPVRRYLSHVIPDGHPYVDTVRLEQEGELRQGEGSWHRFTAKEAVTVDPPGFVWQATVGLLPGLPLSVSDRFRDGVGAARVSLFDLVPVGSADPGSKLNESALMRYLAEAVWYPTALLPSEGVQWDAIDDRSARATLTSGGTTASLVFHVDDRDEVWRVEGTRYRRVDDGFEATPWSGYWRDYRVRNGVRVPVEGESVWHRSGTPVSVWRGRLVDIEHRPGGT